MVHALLSGVIGIMAIAFLAFCYQGFARTKKEIKMSGNNVVHSLGQIDFRMPKTVPSHLSHSLLAPTGISVATRGQSRNASQVLVESTTIENVPLVDRFEIFSDKPRNFSNQIHSSATSTDQTVPKKTTARIGLVWWLG